MYKNKHVFPCWRIIHDSGPWCRSCSAWNDIHVSVSSHQKLEKEFIVQTSKWYAFQIYMTLIAVSLFMILSLCLCNICIVKVGIFHGSLYFIFIHIVIFMSYMWCDQQHEMELANTHLRYSKTKQMILLFFFFFFQPFNRPYLWNQLTNFSGSVVKGSFANDGYNQSQKMKIDFDQLQIHFAWSHHIYVQLKIVNWTKGKERKVALKGH